MTTAPELDQLSPVKRAVLELREMRARLESLERERREPLAIVGMGCRFPGGSVDPASFWRLLEGGVDAVREVPPERWDIDAYYDPDPDAPGKMSTRYGGFLDSPTSTDSTRPSSASLHGRRRASIPSSACSSR